jgi:pimeloyl-ACP methyl ester carboxylesterase
MRFVRTHEHGLTCYEQRADSKSLTVFLHGLGLDAGDYFGFMQARPDEHTIAITLAGFDIDFPIAQPVTLAGHAAAISAYLAQTRRRFPDKDLILAGFSLGADMVMRVAEHWAENPSEAPKLRSVLLLDPNVNHSTMTISRLFAQADPAKPLEAFKDLLALVPDLALLEAICAYVQRVARKDFRPIWHLAKDIVGYWDPSGYRQIGQRLAGVAQVAEQMRVAFSAPYREKLPMILESLNGAMESGRPHLEVLDGVEHFDLIRDDILATQLRHVG